MVRKKKSPRITRLWQEGHHMLSTRLGYTVRSYLKDQTQINPTNKAQKEAKDEKMQGRICRHKDGTHREN